MPKFLHTPAPNKAAREFIANKTAVSRAVFDGLLPEVRSRAFTITGVESTSVIARARSRIAKLPEGADWNVVKSAVVEDLIPWLEPERAQRRAELLLRVHGYQAYGAAAYEVMDRQRDVFPFWQYQSADDGKVRPTHAALDGKVVPANSPFWQSHYPPWEFGCRCSVAALSDDDVQDIRDRDVKRVPEARRVIEGDRLRRLETDGNLQAEENGVPRNLDVRTPREKQDGSGFYWNPGDLKLSLAELRNRYKEHPEAWEFFETWARKQPVDKSGDRTVWEWLADGSTEAGMVATGFLDSATAAAASSGTTLAAGPEAMRRRIREANYTTEEDLGGGVNETIILTNGEKVVFKSVEGEYEGVLRPGIEPGTQYRREKAASVIDEILKTDLVPPTEIIEWKGRLGSAQLFQKGYKMPFEYADAGELRDRGFGFLSKRQRQDWNLLDMVLGHSDRHGGNWMLYKREGGWDLALIDNGLCLSDSPTPAYALRAMPAAGLKLDQVAQRRLSRLIDTEADWRPRLAELVSPQAIDHMLERARAIQRHGYFPG